MRLRRSLAALALAAAAAVAPAIGAGDVETQALASFKNGDFSAAAQLYARLLEAQPNDASLELMLGTIRLYENDLQGAQPLLQAAAAANPSDPAAQGRLRELRRRQSEASQIATVQGGEADVPFVTADPLPVVKLRVDGVDATFMIDTGANFFLEPDFAKTLNLALRENGNGIFAGGKHAPMQMTTVDRLDMGTATTRNVTATVLPTHASDFFPGLQIDGVLGTSVFERFLVTIDYPHARLILRPRSSSAAFEDAAQKAGATIVPCWLVGDHFVVAGARVNDASAGLFMFDSGLAGGGLMPSKALLEAAKIQLDSAHAGTGMGGGGPITSVPFVAASIAVGNAVRRDVRGLYSPDGDPYATLFPFRVWGGISNDFLKHYAYTVDFSAMKIVLAGGN